MITKIEIKNFKKFRRTSIPLQPGMNIVVGRNEAGKSTLLEAVTCVLRGRLQSRRDAAITQGIFNADELVSFFATLSSGNDLDSVTARDLPEIVVDLFLDDESEYSDWQGSNNLTEEDAIGMRFRVGFDLTYASILPKILAESLVTRTIPVEFYRTEWKSFQGTPLIARDVPQRLTSVDATRIRLDSGSDYYIKSLVREKLEEMTFLELLKQHRLSKEEFARSAPVAAVNNVLAAAKDGVTDKRFELAASPSDESEWTTAVSPHLDGLPFSSAGSGEQNRLKILLALARGGESDVVLVEEPENHLSFSALNKLIAKISEHTDGKQVLISTHSSFVINKLGLDRLIMLNGDHVVTFSNLEPATVRYFRRLSGYDTLRVVLADRAVLVEGPSDDLLIQRAFRDEHDCLPSERGIDIIECRGLTFARFLAIAQHLKTSVAVVTDNDGDPNKVDAKYAPFVGGDSRIKVFTGRQSDLRTLEPQVQAVNSLETLNQVFDTKYSDSGELLDFMKRNKSEWALRAFDSKHRLKMPPYIIEVLKWLRE